MCIRDRSGNKSSIHDYIKNYWKANNLGSDSWNKALHDGIYHNTSSSGQANKRISNFKHYSKTFTINDSNSLNSFELNIYPKTGMGDGKHANNPWLQEFPDPLTRATWDNYLTISEFDAKETGLYLEPSTFFNQSSHDANGGLNGKYAIIKLGDKELSLIHI